MQKKKNEITTHLPGRSESPARVTPMESVTSSLILLPAGLAKHSHESSPNHHPHPDSDSPLPRLTGFEERRYVGRVLRSLVQSLRCAHGCGRLHAPVCLPACVPACLPACLRTAYRKISSQRRGEGRIRGSRGLLWSLKQGAAQGGGGFSGEIGPRRVSLKKQNPVV